MLIRQTLYLLPAQSIGPLVQFVAVLAWTHWLPPVDYGIVALVLAGQELVFQLCLSWWSSWTLRYLPTLAGGDKARYDAVQNSVLLASAPVQSLVILVMLAWSGELAEPWLVAATVLFTVSRSATTQLAEQARAQGRIGPYTIAQTGGPVLGFLIGWAFIAAFGPSATAVIGGFGIAQTVVLPILGMQLSLAQRLRLDRAMLASAARYGVPLLLTGVVGWVSINGIRLIVEYRDGAAAVGLLSVGWSLGQRLIAVVAMLTTSAAFPLAVRRLASHGQGVALAQIAEGGTLLLGLVLPATLCAVWLTHPLVEAFVGPAFWEATLTILPVAVLAAAARNLRMHWADQVFLLLESPGTLLKINIAEAAGVVILCSAGLVWGGLLGACLGCLAANVGAALVSFWIAIRRHGLGIQAVPIAKIALATMLMVVLIRADWFPPTTLGLLARVAAGCALYLGAAALLFRDRLSALRLGRA